MAEACRALFPEDKTIPKTVQLAISADVMDDVEEKNAKDG